MLLANDLIGPGDPRSTKGRLRRAAKPGLFSLIMGTGITLESALTSTVGADSNSMIGPPVRPKISCFVMLPGCSRTLLASEWVSTARHCLTAVGPNRTQSTARVPRAANATMGAQSIQADWWLAHPRLDLAPVRLSTPFRMEGFTTGYTRKAFSGDPSTRVGENLTCHDFGRNTYNTGFGALRRAIREVERYKKDNVDPEIDDRYTSLVDRINRFRSVSSSDARVIDRLRTHLFDWAVTDNDAREALGILRGLDSHQLRTVVGRMVNKRVFNTLLEELPGEEHHRYRTSGPGPV